MKKILIVVLCIAISPVINAQTVTFTNIESHVISDNDANNPVCTDITINNPNGLSLGLQKVGMRIGHSYVGDLEITLKAPSIPDPIVLWARSTENSSLDNLFSNRF